MSKVLSIFRHWLPMAVLAIAVCGLVYLAVQQALRQTANDPQIQMAEDGAAAIAQGAAVETILPAANVDLARSLAPFVMVFDDAGTVLGSSGKLHGQDPVLPGGVLDYTRQQGQDRITWQPEPGVRIAAVVVRAEGSIPGFVLAGRSLREIEKRESQAELEAGAALIATLVGTLAVVAVSEFLLTGKARAR